MANNTLLVISIKKLQNRFKIGVLLYPFGTGYVIFCIVFFGSIVATTVALIKLIRGKRILFK